MYGDFQVPVTVPKIGYINFPCSTVYCILLFLSACLKNNSIIVCNFFGNTNIYGSARLLICLQQKAEYSYRIRSGGGGYKCISISMYVRLVGEGDIL